MTIHRRLKRLAIILGVGYVLWLSAILIFQDRLIFPGHFRVWPMADLEPPAQVEEVFIPLEDEPGRNLAWYLPEPGVLGSPPRATVFYFHGNHEIIDQMGFAVDGYQQLNCAVVLPEYRGYGRAEGNPSQAKIVSDMVRFYDTIVARPDVDPRKIIFHGRSLGGGVAAATAAERLPAGLILESTFTSMSAMAHRYAAPGFLCRAPFRTDRTVTDLNIPMLIFHGNQDWIVPVSHGRALHAMIADSIYIEYNAGHNDFPPTKRIDDYWQAIDQFMTACLTDK